MRCLRRVTTPLIVAASLVLLVGCGSILEVAVDLHEGAESADLTVTALGDDEAMFARFTLHLERADPDRGEALRRAALGHTGGDVDRVLDEAGIPAEEFDDFVAHVLERGIQEADSDSYAEVHRRREEGTLTLRSVERGPMRGQAMTVMDVAVEDIPEVLGDLVHVDVLSSLEEVIVTRDGDALTVVFDTGREQDGADLSAVSPFEHDLVVSVPGEVLGHNAKEVDGSRLQWNQAAIAKPTVTYRPGPVADRGADSESSRSRSGGDATEAEEAGALGGGRADRGRGSSLSFGSALAGLVAVALLAVVVAAVVLDRRSGRPATPEGPYTPQGVPPTQGPYTPQGASPQGFAVAGWYGDPTGQARLRWWDGRRWTEHQA